MANNNYIPQVDYTSRDYSAIRRDLINLIQFYNPAWTNRDASDFGMTLIELFSYLGDILNYYVDRSANEAFITTASQRDSVLQIAKLLSYIPTDSTAATVTLTFQNSTASPITVPAKTKVTTTNVTSSTSVAVIFETDSAVTVPAKSAGVNGSATVTATQGETQTESIGPSDGGPDQRFALSQYPVISGSISISINGVAYNNVQYLIDYNSNDPVFTTYTEASGITYIKFGDNISGRIPPTGASISVTYRTGGGVSGNAAANTIQYMKTVISGITVNNQAAATGGADPESTDSIRLNAPLSVRSLNRAVSLRDYAALCLNVGGVAKASSVADVYTSVTIYIAPFGDRGVLPDNVTPTTAFGTLTAAIRNYLADKAPANTTVSLLPPSYVTVDMTINLTILPQYKQSLVQTAVRTALYDLLNIDNVTFADRITLSDIMTVINSVPGVAYPQVLLLVRTDKKQQYTITNKALTSSVATLTTSATHNMTVGQTVQVSGVGSPFDGTYIITAVTGTTFSYAVAYTNVASSAASGTSLILTTTDIVCDVNEIPEMGSLTLSSTGGIV